VTILLYALFVVGIPNIVGILFSFLLLPLAAFPRWIFPRISLNNPLLVIPTGFTLGLGCGIAGVLIVMLFGKLPGGALPLISSIWALIYYSARRQSKIEAFSNVAGIYAVWLAYWIWKAKSV
jgi:hypothetical protein